MAAATTATRQPQAPWRIGIDVGGTFTDVILFDEETGAISGAKVPSTPANQAEGFGKGLAGVGATLLGVAAAYVKLPGTIATEVAALTDNVYVVLLLLGMVYVILGMFLDPNSVILLTLPVIIPTIDALGINRIWFEVYLVLMVEMANVTPPIGFNLYVIQGISGHSIKTIAIASTPFVMLLALGAVIITIFPDIALWLPRTQYS